MVFRLIILAFLVQFTTAISAQENFSLEGIVVDVSGNLPLKQVNVSLLGVENQGTTTDSLGHFFIKATNLPTTLKFSFVGYETKTIEVKLQNLKRLYIQLSPLNIPLPEISVSSKRKINTVFREPLNVIDYAFVDNFLVLLIYRNVFEKNQLVVLDQSEKVIATLSLTDYRPSGLFTSCTEAVYLTTDLGVFPVLVTDSSIALDKYLDIDYYENFIRPCKLATEDFVYFSKYYYQGQAQQYIGFSKEEDNEEVRFPMIQHEHNIDLLVEETGNAFPRSGDVWEENISGKLASLRDSPYELRGMMKIFYPTLYSPIVKRDSLLCIFNHQESELQYFTAKGLKVSRVPIEYHRLKKWNKELFCDAKNETVYTTFDTRWGQQICAIDMESGALGEAITIDRDFIKNIKVRDGYLYFLYRNPYHGTRNRMLQKVRLD